ncbi:hypothetical protein, partial [Salinicola sp.]|uniref:hypothetical protein n=1 Tax=Salinicola sp. TaxID=1978524 RepID=UPI0025E2A073
PAIPTTPLSLGPATSTPWQAKKDRHYGKKRPARKRWTPDVNSALIKALLMPRRAAPLGEWRPL